MKTLDEVLTEKKKRDRCLRIAVRKFDKPSAYKSGAVVRCRKGDIWKGVKEEVVNQLTEDESLRKWFKRSGPSGKEGGWVDCNTGRKDPKTGKMKYKACGRKKEKKEQNTRLVDQHLQNVKIKEKVKNGEKRNKSLS